MARRRCAVPPRPCSPAPPPSCSACSPCCSRWSRPPAASASPARSASWSPPPSCWWCCPPRWCSSAAGSSGRGCRTSATPALVERRLAVAPGRRPRRGAVRRPFVAGTLLLLGGHRRSGCSGSRPGSTRPTSSWTSPRRSRPPSGSPSRSPPAPSDPTAVLTRDDADAGAGDRRGRRRRGLGAPGHPAAATASPRSTSCSTPTRARRGREHTVERLRDALATFDDTHVGGTEADRDRRARGRRSATGW